MKFIKKFGRFFVVLIGIIVNVIAAMITFMGMDRDYRNPAGKVSSFFTLYLVISSILLFMTYFLDNRDFINNDETRRKEKRKTQIKQKVFYVLFGITVIIAAIMIISTLGLVKEKTYHMAIGMVASAILSFAVYGELEAINLDEYRVVSFVFLPPVCYLICTYLSFLISFFSLIIALGACAYVFIKNTPFDSRSIYIPNKSNDNYTYKPSYTSSPEKTKRESPSTVAYEAVKFSTTSVSTTWGDIKFIINYNTYPNDIYYNVTVKIYNIKAKTDYERSQLNRDCLSAQEKLRDELIAYTQSGGYGYSIRFN